MRQYSIQRHITYLPTAPMNHNKHDACSWSGRAALQSSDFTLFGLSDAFRHTKLSKQTLCTTSKNRSPKSRLSCRQVARARVELPDGAPVVAAALRVGRLRARGGVYAALSHGRVSELATFFFCA